MTSNGEYYRKRLDEETLQAKASSDVSVRHVHETLAKMYRVRLRAEEQDIPALEPTIHVRARG